VPRDLEVFKVLRTWRQRRRRRRRRRRRGGK